MFIYTRIQRWLPLVTRGAGAAALRIFALLVLAVPRVGLAGDNNKPSAASAAPVPRTWGTYQRPFAVDSPWNSRPVNPKLGTQVIPTAQFQPSFEDGFFSTGVFLGKAGDGPVTVTGVPVGPGLYDADAETFHDTTIPHWPADVVPAGGSDGHADIVDTASGIIHSFYQLRHQNGQWVASQYAWTPLDGRGWGDPAHYFQGSRATAVTPTAGLIRTQEISDGDSMYRHALSISLTQNGLAANPAYVFPATSADFNAAATNTGFAPEGALMMLPYSFDIRQITDPAVRKVAQTLKTYGAYVVDRNQGVPFSVYAEIGSGLSRLNASTANDMEKIRLALRQVLSVKSWLDGNGHAVTPDMNLNLLSMRGTWQTQSGPGQGQYETLAQALLIPATSAETTLVNFSNRGLTNLLWATPIVGTSYRLTAITTGNAKFRLRLYDLSTSAMLYDSGLLQGGQSVTFPWPAQNAKATLQAVSGVGLASSVSGELVRAD